MSADDAHAHMSADDAHAHMSADDAHAHAHERELYTPSSAKGFMRVVIEGIRHFLALALVQSGLAKVRNPNPSVISQNL